MSFFFSMVILEKIAELEKKYDFTDVSVKEREEAKKLLQAVRPSSSRAYGYHRLHDLVEVESYC